MSIPTTVELFSSVRYDPNLISFLWNTWPENAASPFLLFPYHYDRLVEAARHFEWHKAVNVLSRGGNRTRAVASLKEICQQYLDSVDGGSTGPLRLRITISHHGAIKIQSFPTVPLHHDLLYASTFNPDSPTSFQFPTRQLKVYIDTEPTAQSIYTSYKTTSRAHYDAARSRLAISASLPEEVLLYNHDGDIMEGSVRNVAFWRGGRWITPALESGCLAGTVRRWLIEQGRVVEGTVKRDDIKIGEWALLCNGVEGCLLGTVSVR